MPSKAGSKPLLTVGIANYNGRDMLAIVLDSLATQSLSDFRVVVVDDCSTDDSVSWLRSQWPDVEVIVHPTNRGVTATLNSCLNAGDTEFIALLNNDVELHPDCLSELVSTLIAHPPAGVVCAKLVDYHDRSRLDGAGDIYTWGGEANRRGQGKIDSGQYDAGQEIFGACAATAVYRRSALDVVGNFDERLFAIYEDVDWCFRAQLRGFRCRYVPQAIAYHIGSATLGKDLNDFTLYHNWRNGIWVIAKNYPRWALLRHLPELVFVQLRNLTLALLHGRVRIWLRAWRDACLGIRPVLAERRVVQRTRTTSLSELERVVAQR